MELFDKIFNNKSDKSLIPLRFQAGEKFQKIITSIGVKSFRVQVGDDDGKYTDILFLITETPNNPDVNAFLRDSLTKAHTAKNLMSIGFKQIIVAINDGSGQGYFTDLKDYAK